MDRSKALQKILESADLVGMVQDLTDPSRKEAFTPSSWSGMRITLRTVREILLEAHKSLAQELVADSRASVENMSSGSARGQALRAAVTQASRPGSNPISSSSQPLNQAVERTIE